LAPFTISSKRKGRGKKNEKSAKKKGAGSQRGGKVARGIVDGGEKGRHANPGKSLFSRPIRSNHKEGSILSKAKKEKGGRGTKLCRPATTEKREEGVFILARPKQGTEHFVLLRRGKEGARPQWHIVRRGWGRKKKRGRR